MNKILKFLYIILGFATLTSCEEDMILDSEVPWQYGASVVFIFENEDGENLLNPNSSETIIPENPTFEGNIYVKTQDDTYRAYWSEFNDPDFKYNGTSLLPILYIRNLKNIKNPWEKWDPAQYDDQDYALCLCFPFHIPYPSHYDFIITSSYQIYIDGTDIRHTFTLTCPMNGYLDNADMEAHCKYLLDGVEPGEQPFRIVVKSKS